MSLFYMKISLYLFLIDFDLSIAILSFHFGKFQF